MNWIVVPLRNGISYTMAALPTFLRQDIGNVSVLAIDNDSSDGTCHWMRNQPGVLYWHRRPPLSVAASWNLALNWLFGEQRAEYVLVSNNDVLLRPDTYRQLVKDGGLFVTGVGVDDATLINPPYSNPDPANKRPHPHFALFLIRKECWKRIGQFDESYAGAYCEDSDYHIRMHRAGIVAESLDLPFYHAGSGTSKSATPEEAERIHQMADANRERFKAQYGCVPGSAEYEALFAPLKIGQF